MEKVLYDIWTNGGSPVIVGLVLFGYMKLKFDNIEKSLNNKTWKETCDERHETINKNIEQLRHKVFNSD